MSMEEHCRTVPPDIHVDEEEKVFQIITVKIGHFCNNGTLFIQAGTILQSFVCKSTRWP
jgi:hypothetical protein